ncbi:M23 family metallopeptidase [Corynebacterium sp. LK2590]|uniref:M23 family metallopeptidase n=1 Tax=unclassified Corynebacterium TaxID=2624378 RepID=UPI0034CF340B
MRSKTQRADVGRHRKTTTSQTAKGRIALVTVAAGAASTAGVGGAAAAQLQANADQETKAQSVDYDLTTDSNELAENGAAAVENAAPQILAIAESKPVDNLSEQLNKAIEAADARIAADAASRAPSIVKPAEGAYTSGFGARWGAMHNGIDLANAIGTPIVAAMDGIVIDSGPASGFGNWIRIKHEDGSIAVYGHMETLDVAVGDQVHAGQKIAGMGSRGFSTGSHLHFEIHPDGNTPVDPIPWFAEHGINIS